MANIIKCPKCGNPVEITEALKLQIQEEVLLSERKKYEQELEKAKKEAGKKLAGELEELKEEAKKKEEQLERARKLELDLRKQKNLLEDEKRSFELEKQRQIDYEREKIRRKTEDEIMERQRLKEKEKDQVIESLKKSLEEAKRKAEQGSQQLQGEVQEIDLEESLRENFPNDVIEPVGKGVSGADVRQIVRSPKGIVCGTILWESKRTKSWTDSWISKLKEDARSDKANISAIVSQVLPDEAKKGMGFKNGVWVCSFSLFTTLSALLRKSLLDAAYQKAVSKHRQTKAEDIYSYVTSHEFQQQVEALVETYFDMKTQIEKERASFERSWKQREAQIRKIISGVGSVYGYMQGIAGPALPPIKKLELESGEE